MQLNNLKVPAEQVSFLQAVRQGLGQQQGLFFPSSWPKLDIEHLLSLPLVQRSAEILSALIGDELSPQQVHQMVAKAFTFPAPLVAVNEQVHCLELFHGPTLAFKDFGGRFMAQALAQAQQQQHTTIVTATSGDTGAAVAHAFFKQPGVQVVILYPKGKISMLQEKLFTTLGENITTVAVEGDFDQCQALVKQVFDHKALVAEFNINSANSINISRLFAQICYYFEAMAQVPVDKRSEVVIAVPSGNFGNLTAGLIAKALGLPIKRLVAATNLNDTVPRYWLNGEWQPKDTRATLSNAMDVSAPNNWPRVEALLAQGVISRSDIEATMVDEDDTQVGMRLLAQEGYLSEPHAAVAYKALKRSLQPGEFGIFLGTAHPAKFKEQVENILGNPIALPAILAKCAAEPGLNLEIPADFSALEHVIRQTAAQ
ncbi:threonine synthase [Alishewanella sp. SMS8]|uniref:threonine synthase n=1 Tax=Alishewanella sp. SMS8 TaxID=2994676 RepID=UPI0027423DC7|nr:threonine synthase [Alishewanella sp. SMS8]MDP4945702.1 threonine synthase [Alishewanella sp.]MDP5035115.1 threonine synthase [Alishewanella sp.]MDP5188037.1 threonine synthase [Alishewanella sp.]MDP5458615.1 threonine synthase [Alishewanella sp. SMS8]